MVFKLLVATSCLHYTSQWIKHQLIQEKHKSRTVALQLILTGNSLERAKTLSSYFLLNFTFQFKTNNPHQ